MAFDKPTRNRLAKFVSDARGVIADEFTEQFQSLYGISTKGEIAPLDKLGHLDDAGLATAALLRERIDYLEKTHPDDKDGTRAAVARLAREQAFTILNRLAAIRMAEKRGLIVESVGQGYQSRGFKVFETVAGSALGDTYHRYRRFLFCLFDELAIDLGILFDRRSPQALLFPREPALLALLDLVNDQQPKKEEIQLEPLWAEDETIGWIYQYYNDPEERKKMRKESAAPRNSRELAVRNQFFTPRYVVEFLTDNTLGRIWYEMCGGATSLKDQCRYLVRRPDEVFFSQQAQSHGEHPDHSTADAAQVLQTGDNQAFPEFDASAESVERMIALAHTVDGYARHPMSEDTFAWMDDFRKQASLSSGFSGISTIEILDALFLECRKDRQGGDGTIYGEPWFVNACNEVRRRALRSREEGLSQEELLKQPVFIPHRPLKDPREIRLLDPACGSMHFGLYAFDLFETIYEEFWDLATSSSPENFKLKTENSHAPLNDLYASKEDYMRDVPRLIIENNVHGIDIDPRAVQIAGLSLWLRAQRAWQARGVKPANRPRVRRSNIVCAEPMPGSPEMLESFIAALDPPRLGDLVRTVFDKMQLAGEAGSLLKIEEEIRTAIDSARKDWLKQQDDLLTRKDGSQEEFFQTAEQQVIDALRAYAEQADADSYQRRLFADDAARGFAFIDLCRKRYDAVVMNPPFGDFSAQSKPYLTSCFGSAKFDIYACFISRCIEALTSSGYVGALTSRIGLLLYRSREWRIECCASGQSRLGVMADLGYGVLDNAAVQVAAYTIRKCAGVTESHFINLRNYKPDCHDKKLLSKVLNPDEDVYLHKVEKLSTIPGSPFAYWIAEGQLDSLSNSESLSDHCGIKQGIATGDNERFLRLFWETRPYSHTEWPFYNKGGEVLKYYFSNHLRASWKNDGNEMKRLAAAKYGSASRTIKNEDTFFKFGLSFPLVSKYFCVRPLPSGFIYDMHGCSIYSQNKKELLFLMGYLNSQEAASFLELFTDDRSWQVVYVSSIPVPSGVITHKESIANLSEIAAKCLQKIDSFNEESPIFSRPISVNCYTTDSVNAIILDARSEALNSHQSIGVLCNDIVSAEVEDHFADALVSLGDYSSKVIFEALVSQLLGTAFGRWDIRYATGERQPPELPDPFDPLPVCPPGMLQNAEGLPAEPKDVPADYPLPISWPGILVDDENHPEDIVARVRQAIEVIWPGSAGSGTRAEAIEQEACEILGVNSLRDYFAKPAKFFADHLKRYSKSRRQAPIYWPLSTKTGSYTLWLYYHRLTDQTLFSCVTEFVKPKIEQVATDLGRLRAEQAPRTQIDDMAAFLAELTEFRDELLRIAALPWKPNLNDGVLITASPLWKLFRLPKWQKDLKACWQKLEKGDYDWAHLAHTIWPTRVEKACETDRSLAIAHGLEHLCKVEPPKPKGKRGKKKANEESDLI